MLNDVIEGMRCKRCGSKLVEVKIKERFLEGEMKGKIYLACLDCMSRSDEIRRMIGGSELAVDLYPIESVK